MGALCGIMRDAYVGLMPTFMRSTPPVRSREPAINLPGWLATFIVILLAIHGLRALLSPVGDLDLLTRFSFLPGRWSAEFGWTDIDALVAHARDGFDAEGAEIREGFAHYVLDLPGPHAWTFLTYALLHGSWTHVVLNCVWLAAFGAPVVRRIGNLRSVVLTLATAVAGALTHWAANPESLQPMIGASAIVSGVMAAASLFAFEPQRARTDAGPASRLDVYAGLLRNRTAVMFLGSWFVLNIVFGLVAGPLGLVDGGIAWEAHIGGLVVGLLLFPFIDPGPASPALPGPHEGSA